MAFCADGSKNPPEFYIQCDGGEVGTEEEQLPPPFEDTFGYPWIPCNKETEHGTDPRAVIATPGWQIVEDSAYCPDHASQS